MVLSACACYTIPRTDTSSPHGHAMRCPVLRLHMHQAAVTGNAASSLIFVPKEVNSAICLPACYDMSGTDMQCVGVSAYAPPTRYPVLKWPRVLSAYAFAMRCPVPPCRTTLSAHVFAMRCPGLA
eukprot:1552182-Rhodomonas_salina.6